MRPFRPASLFDKTQAPWPELTDDLAGITAKYNLAPTRRATVVLGGGDKLELRKLRWGLIPPRVKDLKGGYGTIDVRALWRDGPGYKGAGNNSLHC